MSHFIAKTIKSAILPVVLLSVSGLALAHKAGDTIVRAGYAQVSPDASSSAVLGVAGSGVDVKNNAQLGLTGTYMLTDNFGIEVLAATPFQHDIVATGSIASFGKIGSTKHLPPTFSAQYYFTGSDSKINPYVGIGVNYTTFFSNKTTQNLNDAVAAVTGLTVTSTSMKLDDSFGVAFEAGVDFNLDNNWVLNVSVWKADIDTTAKINVNNGAANAQVDVNIDPIVYMIGVGYTF